MTRHDEICLKESQAFIYLMFKDCARLERNVFVTWKENDVNEQDVDERKEY